MRRYLFKPNGSRIWRARIKLDSDAKAQDVSLRTSDRQAAEKKLREMVSERERETAGIIAPKALRDAAVTPLSDHLSAYLDDLRTKGRDEMYVYNVEKRIEKLLSACRWEYPRHVTADSFVGWRSANRDKAAKTLNEYLDAMRGLLKWMIRQGRLESNPLAVVGTVETRGREVRQRRAFTDSQLYQLVTVATPERRALYLLAAFSGLRKAELESLTWADVCLNGEGSSVTVRASMTKNHKMALLPLHQDATEALRAIQPACADSCAPVFARVPWAYQFREDLAKAGIPYKDGQGRQADFHALRHTLATNLARAGVQPRVAMEVMRHSDMKLTAKTYTDATQLSTYAAIKSLPSLCKPASQIASHVSDVPVHSLSQPVTVVTQGNPAEVLDNKGDGHDLAATGTDGHNVVIGCRTRTRT